MTDAASSAGSVRKMVLPCSNPSKKRLPSFCGETVNVFAAGRTDTGVHALGQVAHFDISRSAEPDTVRDAINFYLKPAAVVVLNAEIAATDFHARFSARERSYLYRITNRRVPLALDRDRSWWIPVPLDAQAMADAATVLTGRHDFTTFRASICQAKVAGQNP